jgi:hypothetical protein
VKTRLLAQKNFTVVLRAYQRYLEDWLFHILLPFGAYATLDVPMVDPSRGIALSLNPALVQTSNNTRPREHFEHADVLFEIVNEVKGEGRYSNFLVSVTNSSKWFEIKGWCLSVKSLFRS